MKVAHAWLKEYIGENIPSAEQIGELLTFHAFEVEGIEKVGSHDVIEVKILPDRGSDCLSHRGIAREIASITGAPLSFDPLLNPERLPVCTDISVDITDTKACSRFGAVSLESIEVTDSPTWLQERLQALGQRPINNIVDATNYVMYALGQPTHAYDADKFPQQNGVWKFNVRFARKDEKVSLIAEGGKQEDRIVELEGSELLIVDGSSDTPIGLAGVKGGKYAGVDKSTKNIIVEAAHFDSILTRKTARRLGIVIDASKRFENNPSPELIPHTLREVALLILEIAGGTCRGAIDVDHSDKTTTSTTISVEQVNQLLGLSLSKEQMGALLERIGATVTVTDVGFGVVSPFERTDLVIAEDYIEEIGRLHGYSHVVSEVPTAVPLSEINVRHYYSEKVREFLIGNGFSEVITSSFNNSDTVQLRNALASDKSYLRGELKGSVAEVVDKNIHFIDLLGLKDLRVFEIGTVFGKEGGTIVEHVSLCVGVRTKVKGYTQADDTLVTGILKDLQNELGTEFTYTLDQGVAETNFTDIFSKLPTPLAYESVAVAKEIVYKPFSLYPAMSRDIALWVTEGVEPEAVVRIINEHAGPLRVRTALQDVFTKEGRTSFAFRLVFQSYEKTLTDEEVNVVMDLVYSAVTNQGWETR